MSAAQLKAAAAYVRRRARRAPTVGVVLGSGLSDALTPPDAVDVPFSRIPYFPRAGVQGHAGVLSVGRRVAVLKGRVHYYEGHDPDRVVFPVRLLGMLGVRTLILTNAAGAIDRALRPGQLVLIRDHLNLMGVNPLRGPNLDELGPRFPDTSTLWHRPRGLGLRSGVYAAVAGPSYETPAEIRMLRRLGADLVGMSTVPEAIAARHMGMRVIGISLVTNMAAGILRRPLSHAEVIETGRGAWKRLAGVLERLVSTS